MKQYYVIEAPSVGQAEELENGAGNNAVEIILEYAPAEDFMRAGGCIFCSEKAFVKFVEHGISGAVFGAVKVSYDEQFSIRNPSTIKDTSLDLRQIMAKGTYGEADVSSFKGRMVFSYRAVEIAKQLNVSSCSFTSVEDFEFDWEKRRAALFEEMKKGLDVLEPWKIPEGKTQ